MHSLPIHMIYMCVKFHLHFAFFVCEVCDACDVCDVCAVTWMMWYAIFIADSHDLYVCHVLFAF